MAQGLLRIPRCTPLPRVGAACHPAKTPCPAFPPWTPPTPACSEEPLPEYRKSPACMAREGKEEGGPGEDRDGEGSRGGDSPSSPMEVDLVEGDGTVAEGGAADAQRLVAIKPDPGAVASPRRGARRLVMDEDD